MKETKTRVGAIIIEDNKLLMLKGKKHEEFWTPGGKIDENESEEDCLRRELREELRVEVVDFKFYKEYSAKSFYHDYTMKNKIYIVSVKGKLKPAMEIEKFLWISKEEFEKHKLPMIPIIEEQVIPNIIKEGYLT